MATQVVDQVPRVQYTAAGAQTVFVYNFQIFVKTDITVEQNGTPLTVDVDFTVSGVANINGGNVTLTSGATAGDIITVYRSQNFDRETDYQDSGDFLAPTVNADFNRMILMLQQNREELARSIHYVVDDIIGNAQIPLKADRLSKLLSFDANGDLSVTTPGSGAPDNALNIIYDPAGAGAVATTVQAKLREIVSASDFGVVADGVTDDIVALQAAVNSLGSGGGKVILPVGSTFIGSTLTIVEGGITLEGQASYLHNIIDSDGHGSRIVTTVTDLVCIDVTGANITASGGAKTVAFTLRNLGVFGVGQLSATGSGAGLQFNSTSFLGGFALEGVNIRGHAIGVNFPGSGGAGIGTITNSAIHANIKGVVGSSGAINAVHISGNAIRQNSNSLPAVAGSNYIDQSTGVGISFSSCNGIDISGNDLEGQPTGVFLANADGVDISGNYFEAMETCSVCVNGASSNIGIGPNFIADSTARSHHMYLNDVANAKVHNNGNSGYIEDTSNNSVRVFLAGDNLVNLDFDEWSNYFPQFGAGFIGTADAAGVLIQDMNFVEGQRIEPIAIDTSSLGLVRATWLDVTDAAVGETLKGPRGETNHVKKLTGAGGGTGQVFLQTTGLTVAVGDWIAYQTWVYVPSAATGDLVIILTDNLDGAGSTSKFTLSATGLALDTWHFLTVLRRIDFAGSYAGSTRLSMPSDDDAYFYNFIAGHYDVLPSNPVEVNATTGASRFRRVSQGRDTQWDGSAAPTDGTWAAGEIVYDTTPSAGGTLGWVCVTAGTPGTWKTFGDIAA